MKFTTILILVAVLIIPYTSTILAQDVSECDIEAIRTDAIEALDSAESLDEIQTIIDNLNTTLAECEASDDEADTVVSDEDEVERDGETRETALLMGEPGLIVDGQGSLVIERFVRGADYRHARHLSYRRPDTGKEWLIVWATFTCEVSLCDPIDDQAFFLVGDNSVVYGNLVLANGGQFDDQLVGQTLEGGSVSGWLWFQVEQDDSNFYLLNDSEDSSIFSLSSFAPGTQVVRVTSTSLVNLRSCANTTCEVVGQASPNEELLVISEEGDWYKVKLSGGEEAFIFSGLVQLVQ